jgi:hypothetical protein
MSRSNSSPMCNVLPLMDHLFFQHNASFLTVPESKSQTILLANLFLVFAMF